MFSCGQQDAKDKLYTTWLRSLLPGKPFITEEHNQNTVNFANCLCQSNTSALTFLEGEPRPPSSSLNQINSRIIWKKQTKKSH